MGTEVPSSEARLIGRARRGDVQAFGRLVELNKDYIFNAVFHLLGNAVDAEDISQEVFLRAFRHLNDFEGRARFRTWLYGIMLNAVRSFWRRRTLRGTVSLDGGGEGAPLPDPPGPTDGPDAAADRRERVEAVRAAIGARRCDPVILRALQPFEGERPRQHALGRLRNAVSGHMRSAN